MKSLLFVFIGGGLGSMLRYLLGIALQPQSQIFPWKTWVANIIGCFLLGLFSTLLPAHNIDNETKLLLTTGLCGGFTTFSTFSTESLQLLQSGHVALGITYIATSILTGLLAAYFGWYIGK